MKRYQRYRYTGRSINWFGCFPSIRDGVMYIKEHGASCRLEKNNLETYLKVGCCNIVVRQRAGHS